MKKQLFLAATLIATFFTANAQTNVYTQNFEGNSQDILDEGWAVVGLHGSTINNGIYNSSPSIQAVGINGKSIGFATFTINGTTPQHIQNADCTIISPEIHLPAGNSILKYRVGSVKIGTNASSHYSVYIVTEDEMLTVNNAAQLKTLINAKIPADAATISNHSSIITINLSAYANKTIYTIFRLHDSPTNTLLLFDDVIVTNGILSTDDLAESHFAIYPNPAKGIINIEGRAQIQTITFTDVTGKMVTANNFNGSDKAQLDISGLTKGVYVMTIKSDKGILSKKIVKS